MAFQEKSISFGSVFSVGKVVFRSETYDYVGTINRICERAQKARKDAFVPQIDYSNPFSFAKFGSANLYYKSAIDRIPDFYPYDGSDAEITDLTYCIACWMGMGRVAHVLGLDQNCEV